MANETTRNDYQRALMELIGCRPVAYWPYLARKVGGVQEAIMLSQLLYWNGDKTVRERGGWLWKTVSDMYDETGLTKIQQQTARDKLVSLGVLECELRGVPRCWRYRVDLDKLGEVIAGNGWEGNPSNGLPIQWDDHSTGNPPNIGRNTRGMFVRKPAQHPAENPPNLNKNLRLHSETTPETTTETTTTTAPIVTSGVPGRPLVVVDWQQAKKELVKMGIWKNVIPDYITLAMTCGWTESGLIQLTRQLQDRYSQDRACSLLKYRIESSTPIVDSGYTQSPQAADNDDSFSPLSDDLVGLLFQRGLSDSQIDTIEEINQVQGWTEDELRQMADECSSPDVLVTYLQSNPRGK